MIINKFFGKTEDEAKQKARAELGENCVVMNVKEVAPRGLFRYFRKPTFELTAALEEKENYRLPPFVPSGKPAEKINLSADEPIVIPPIEKEFETAASRGENRGEKAIPAPKDRSVDTASEALETIEKKLADLTTILEEKQLSASGVLSNEERGYMRLIYNALLEHDVNERYANHIVEELEKTIRPGNNLDLILANVYQKLILRIGRPSVIEPAEMRPKVVFFIGPTGVGKTTTIAKISSKFKLEEHRDIALVTTDTYRIAAAEQLNIYAEILGVPISVVYSPEDLNEAIEGYRDKDIIFVDTAGFSHKNLDAREDTKKMIDCIPEEIEREVYLVMSATTKESDLEKIADVYQDIADYKMIFTKVDETDTLGCMLNLRLYTGADLSYITTGQNVPNDIEVLNTQKLVKKLLGGN